MVNVFQSPVSPPYLILPPNFCIYNLPIAHTWVASKEYMTLFYYDNRGRISL
jgi:hypothetical protein